MCADFLHCESFSTCSHLFPLHLSNVPQASVEFSTNVQMWSCSTEVGTLRAAYTGIAPCGGPPQSRTASPSYCIRQRWALAQDLCDLLYWELSGDITPPSLLPSSFYRDLCREIMIKGCRLSNSLLQIVFSLWQVQHVPLRNDELCLC